MHPSSDEIIHLYERHARAWDAARGRSLVERAWLDKFLAVVEAGNLGADTLSVLDLGCGAGEPIAGYLIEQKCRVTGIDSSPSLLKTAAARFPDQVWTVGDMRGLDLGFRYGGIIAWDSFFHLTAADQHAMFPIFRRHAATGAALMFTSGPTHAEAIGSFEGEPLYHASLSADAYKQLLAENGFSVVAHVAEDRDCGGHTVWLAKAQA